MNKYSHTKTTRALRRGEWYWASKCVIQSFASSLGFSALAVYHFLASMAGDEQRCYPSQRYIAERLGCSRATVCKAIKGLSAARLIDVRKRNYTSRMYQLLDVRCNPTETKVSTERNYPVQNVDTNKNYITRLNNNRGRSKKKRTPSTPTTRAELLARDIAETLKDTDGYAKYLSYAAAYHESVLREMLSEVRQTPDNKIKKSRQAFFHYLVKRYEETS